MWRRSGRSSRGSLPDTWLRPASFRPSVAPLPNLVVRKVEADLRRQVQAHLVAEHTLHRDIRLRHRAYTCGHVALTPLADDAEELPAVRMEKHHAAIIGEQLAKLSRRRFFL